MKDNRSKLIFFASLRPNKILSILVIVAFMLAALTLAVTAEEKPAESAWEFNIALYLGAISMNGNATVKGLEADLDLSFSGTWNELGHEPFGIFPKGGRLPWREILVTSPLVQILPGMRSA